MRKISDFRWVSGWGDMLRMASMFSQIPKSKHPQLRTSKWEEGWKSSVQRTLQIPFVHWCFHGYFSKLRGKSLSQCRFSSGSLNLKTNVVGQLPRSWGYWYSFRQYRNLALRFTFNVGAKSEQIDSKYRVFDITNVDYVETNPARNNFAIISCDIFIVELRDDLNHDFKWHLPEYLQCWN